MRVLRGVLLYLMVAVAVVSGAAAFVFFAFQPAVEMVAAAQQETPKVAPRLQASLDRKAEGLRRYAEKEKAAALAEKEQAEQLRIRIASTGPEAAMARAGHDDAERARGAPRSTAADAAMARAPHDDAEKERAARAKKRAQREARRRSELYATEARWSSNPVRLHGPE